MRFALNLRWDLAKLSDADLVARLEAVWRAHDAAYDEAKRKHGGAREPTTIWCSARGPIRHRLAYMFTSMLVTKTVGLLRGALPPAALLYLGEPLAKMHFGLCEILDINDELERRKSKRLT
jgi:hypothetical protein